MPTGQRTTTRNVIETGPAGKTSKSPAIADHRHLTGKDLVVRQVGELTAPQTAITTTVGVNTMPAEEADTAFTRLMCINVTATVGGAATTDSNTRTLRPTIPTNAMCEVMHGTTVAGLLEALYIREYVQRLEGDGAAVQMPWFIIEKATPL